MVSDNISAKHDEADETVARITEENKKLIEELQIKEQLLHNIKSKLFGNSETFFLFRLNLVDISIPYRFCRSFNRYVQRIDTKEVPVDTEKVAMATNRTTNSLPRGTKATNKRNKAHYLA